MSSWGRGAGLSVARVGNAVTGCSRTRACATAREDAGDQSIHSNSSLCSDYTNGYLRVMTDSTTPTIQQVAELRKRRDELDEQITRLTPRAIEEGYAAGYRAEVIAVNLGISVSRVHQIRRAHRTT